MVFFDEPLPKPKEALMEEKILFVDDEKEAGMGFKRILHKEQYKVEYCESGKKALTQISVDLPNAIVTDIMMPEMDGLTLMKNIQEIDSELPVILITGKGNIPMAVKAIQDGAYDFIEKPFELEVLQKTIAKALEKRRLILEVRSLQHENANLKESEFNLIGKSPTMTRLKKVIENIADSEANVLIEGETGTGKDLIARVLHERSKRRKKNFVAINCGAIPETIIESELFGHEEGAFTGASRRRIGKFEYANGGTVFLDEIESMPLHLQVKLLRVIQEREIERLGSNNPIAIDVRIVAATKKDLKQASAQDKFRTDLYYRLNVIQVSLPPLRHRSEDIPYLFQHFVLQACAQYDLPTPEPSPDLMRDLLSRDWEGNVRELKNEAEKYVLGLNLEIPDFYRESNNNNSTDMEENNNLALPEQIFLIEKSIIEQELSKKNGNAKNTYEALGLNRKTFYDKIKKFGINQSDFK